MSIIKSTRCGWCGALISGAPTAIPEEESTGICLPCKRRVEADLDAQEDLAALVKGGQGRDAQDVRDSGTGCLVTIAVAVGFTIGAACVMFWPVVARWFS